MTEDNGNVQLIVSADWLKHELDEGNSNIVILDASFSRKKDFSVDHKSCHIPGAPYFDIFHKVTNTDDYPSNIASEEDFQEYARSLGVNNDSHVVVYDNSGDGGLYWGSRAWYLFKLFGVEKVSVLDSGMSDWKSKGYPTDDKEPMPKQGNFEVKRRSDIYRTFRDMEENLTTKHYQVLDARSEALYKGNPDEPRSGHYPGAFNFTFVTKLLNPETGRFKTADEFKKLFEEQGVDLSRPVVTHCKGGVSSCGLMMALAMAGAKDYSMFHGGATLWYKYAKSENIEQSK